MTIGNRKLLIGALAVVLLLAAWWLMPSEEDRILERLEQAARALEQENTRGVMSLIDVERFTDPVGMYDAREIEQGLEEAFRMFENIEVIMERPGIDLQKDERRATVTLRFVITGTYEGQFGFIVGSTQETALARFVMDKNPEAGWQVTELVAAKLPGI